MNHVSEELLKLDRQYCSFEMFFLSLPKNASEHQIIRWNTENSVDDMLFETLISYASVISNREIIPIHEIDKEDEEFLITVELSEVDDLQKQIQHIGQDKYVRAHAHSLGEYIPGLKQYMVHVNDGEKSYYFIRKHTANTLLSPKKELIIVKEDVLASLRNQTIFSLANTFDAVVIDEVVYVSNENNFITSFKYYEKQETRAAEVLDRLEGLDIFDNFDQFRQNIEGKISYIKRLSKLEPQSINLINFDSIVSLQAENEINLNLDINNRKIGFNNSKQFKDAIDLILDNFSVSKVTGIPYRMLNKIRNKK